MVQLKKIIGSIGLEDVCIVLGLVFVFAGLFMYRPEAAFVVTGALLLSLGVWIAIPRGPKGGGD